MRQLDLSRWTSRAVVSHIPAREGEELRTGTQWLTDQRPGWLVPIPVGFVGLSPLHPAGSVANARDMTTPLRFVETVWSIGQWISPHRLQVLGDLVWMPDHDLRPDHTGEYGLYRCVNSYPATTATPI